ncbi:FecR family protein [Methylosinus sporium]|uniref:FecR family protein n=1 Tax=Methylosinus sporium TaxID=428 RepID=UPI000D59BB17|nr:FecR domain-containing protein [Methylosinus sporium]PWB88421.1 iron dicitrate transport regulator FecR [Methylocystis sp. MitZ-2018]
MKEDIDCSPLSTPRDAAIEWWVGTKAGFSREERAEFEAWLTADPANALAYADIERTYSHVRQVRRARRGELRRRRARGRAILVGAALGAAASLAVYITIDPVLTFLRSDFSTGRGEVKILSLADGSNVTLDAGSAIAIRFGADKRRVALLKGEAWFEVANDAARPFVVEADGGTVTALGTTFGVGMGRGGVQIAVGEHAVRVASNGKTVDVAERQQTTYLAQSPPADPSPAPSSLAAWRRGTLTFQDRPLVDVLTTLDRYRPGFIFCLKAEICARPVTAVFSADSPSQALREIEMFLGLHSVHLTDYLIVLYE